MGGGGEGEGMQGSQGGERYGGRRMGREDEGGDTMVEW